MLVIPRGQGIKGEVRSRNDMTSVSAIIRTYEIYNLPQIEMLKLALPFNFFSNELKKYQTMYDIKSKKKKNSKPWPQIQNTLYTSSYRSHRYSYRKKSYFGSNVPFGVADNQKRSGTQLRHSTKARFLSNIQNSSVFDTFGGNFQRVSSLFSILVCNQSFNVISTLFK